MRIIKKISVFVLVFSMLCMIAGLNVSAVAPQWTYQCAKSVYDVNVNGKIDGSEWDDAVELIANNDSEIFKKYGFWQNTGADGPIPSSDLSVTYKLKWDEEYLYILEVRYDKYYIVNSPDDSGPWPWEHSGTLLFLCYDTNYDEPAESGCYEIFWVTAGPNNKPWLSGRAGTGKAQFVEGDAQMAGWVTGGGKSGDTYTFEAAIPWKTMRETSGFPAPAEGVKMRFTPIVSAFLEKGAEKFGAKWNQLDFYVNTDRPDDVTGEGGLELVAAIVVPETIEVAIQTETATTGGGAAPAAPATGDSNILIAIAVMALGIGLLAVTKRHSLKIK